MKVLKALRPLVVLAASVLAISCGVERSPTAPPPANPDLIGGLVGTVSGTVTSTLGAVLSCSKLPEYRASAVIGRDGGILTIGPHTFIVPRGALSHDVTITAWAPSDKNRDIQFGPSGLHFSKPAALTVSYAGCGLLPNLLPRVAYTTDLLSILYYVPSLPTGNQTVTGAIDHFSRYAAAY
jgi:hypothetical protein